MQDVAARAAALCRPRLREGLFMNLESTTALTSLFKHCCHLCPLAHSHLPSQAGLATPFWALLHHFGVLSLLVNGGAELASFSLKFFLRLLPVLAAPAVLWGSLAGARGGGWCSITCGL